MLFLEIELMTSRRSNYATSLASLFVILMIMYKFTKIVLKMFYIYNKFINFMNKIVNV